MELQKHLFRILTGHSMIYCPKEFEPDVLNTFVQRGFKISKFENKCMSSLTLLPSRNFAGFENQFSSNISTKEPNILTITKRDKLFKCL